MAEVKNTKKKLSKNFVTKNKKNEVLTETNVTTNDYEITTNDVKDLLDGIFDDSDGEEKTSELPSQSLFLMDVVESENKPVIKKKFRKKNTESKCAVKENSEIHTGETDSEDDEDNRNQFEAILSSTGKEYASLLKKKTEFKNSLFLERTPPQPLCPSANVPVSTIVATKNELLADPLLKMNIKNPKLDRNQLIELSKNHSVVFIQSIKKCQPGDSNWLTGGVITSTIVRTAKSGNKYGTWKVTDLKGDIKFIKVLLFGSACNVFENLAPGTMVAFVKAKIGECEEKSEATLTVSNPKQIIVLGESKDFGFCGQKTKDGGFCKMAVNLSVCRLCIYHARSEYKTTKLENFKSKVMKSCFPTGSRIITNSTSNGSVAVKRPLDDSWPVAKQPEKKLKMCDMPGFKRNFKDLKKSENLIKDCSILKKLSEKTAISPKLTCDSDNMISLSPVKKKSTRDSLAKQKAIELIRNGLNLQKKPTKPVFTPKETTAPELTPSKELSAFELKKIRMGLTDEFLASMKTNSTNASLVKQIEKDVLDKQFEKRVRTEEITEKLSQTKTVETDAWKCDTCKRTTAGFPKKCKEEGHPLVKVKASKGFFECRDCHRRETFLTSRPIVRCSKCGACSWQRVTMIKPKIVQAIPKISIRGMEQTNVNSVVDNPDINLLVPDSVE